MSQREARGPLKSIAVVPTADFSIERKATHEVIPVACLPSAHPSTESEAVIIPATRRVVPRSHPLREDGGHIRCDDPRLSAPDSPFSAGGGHTTTDTQPYRAPATLNETEGHAVHDTPTICANGLTYQESNGHAVHDTHQVSAGALTPIEADRHAGPDTHVVSAESLDLTCDRLRELHRQRQDLHRAEKSLTLQIKAKCRRLCDGDKKDADVLYAAISGKKEHDLAEYAVVVSMPFIQARELLEQSRKTTEKAMAAEAESLPVAGIVGDVRGFGLGSLAAIIGEAGNLSDYATVSKLWKRMGLAVIAGERQRRKAGADAIEHGYSPSRRSVMWNVGQSVFKAQSARVDKETGEVIREAGKYRQIYDARKEYELPRVETKGHAHNRATRYMEKMFLKDLWRAWRSA